MPKTKKRILVVDDQKTVRELFVKLLKDYASRQVFDVEILEAENMFKALKLLNGLDLVITDKDMPSGIDEKLDAYGNSIAQRAQEKGIRVIGMTGEGNFYPNYINAEFKKPIGMNDFYSILDSFLKGSLYDNMSPERAMNDYSFDILSNLVTPNGVDTADAASEKITKLEKLVTLEGNLTTREYFNQAKIIYEELKTMGESEEYSKKFEQLNATFDAMAKSYISYRKEKSK